MTSSPALQGQDAGTKPSGETTPQSKPDTAKAEQKPAPAPKADTPPKPKTKPKPAPSAPPVAGPVHVKSRHIGMILSFLLLVVAPVTAVGGYLYTMAQDQFVSQVGFTIRREEAPIVSSLMSSLGQVSSASSSDSDILFEYVRSQQLVQRVDEEMDLRQVYSSVHEEDPVFALSPDATIEELADYWRRMVLVSYAPSSGLLELEVRAFDPATANQIAELIFAESSRMINQLSNIAREDTTRYAREELAAAEENLKNIRETLTRFRLRTQIIDPEAAIQGQMGLLNSLQQQLGEALIEYDLLLQTTREGDQRLLQTESRVAAIQSRIAQEQRKFGQGGDAIDGQDYATVIAEFERLSVEREFAEQKYASALANLDTALAEANRQSRYLAAYVGPTTAESAEHPRRPLLLALAGFFAILTWAVLALVYYSLRDRR